jgi:hypothetical protein
MFDPNSGPAFREYLMTREALAAESNADWSRRRPYPSFKPRGTKGPRSLLDIAISVVGDNFGKIRSITHLESLPKVILLRIWRYLEARSVHQRQSCYHHRHCSYPQPYTFHWSLP